MNLAAPPLLFRSSLAGDRSAPKASSFHFTLMLVAY